MTTVARFVVVSTTHAIYSSDAVTWTEASTDGGGYGVVYDGTQFVAVGISSASVSTDGDYWTTYHLPNIPSGYWFGPAWDGSTLVALNNSGTHGAITSPDGITWTSRSITTTAAWFGVCYGAGLFVGVGIRGYLEAPTVITSPDGITWTDRSPTLLLRSVTYGGGQFVAVGDGGAITSPDGITWTSRSIPSASWRGVTHGAGLYVAVAYDGTVATSPDGITWTVQTAPGGLWQGIGWAAGLFVVCGVSSIMTSPDGVIWTLPTLPVDRPWSAVLNGPAILRNYGWSVGMVRGRRG